MFADATAPQSAHGQSCTLPARRFRKPREWRSQQMNELQSCSNCWYRQTCNLDGQTAKSCGMWTPWRPMDYALRWSRFLRKQSGRLLVLSRSLLAELDSMREERQRGVNKP
jgi:hypothetical protein